MLAFPHPGTVRTEFMTRMWTAMQAKDSRISEICDLLTGPAMGLARNTIARRFLESGSEWLWFVDTDMVVNSKTLPALLENADPDEMPVVGALCCVVHDNKVMASVYQTGKHPEDGKFAFQYVEQYPENTLLRVDGTGCGCLLIHRSVFEKIDAVDANPGLWFSEMVIEGRQIGEDLSFCMRLALAEIPVFVHTGIQVGHMKTLQIGEVTPLCRGGDGC